MVPPPSWTAAESSELGRSASLSADPRIQQVGGAAWPLPAWAWAKVSAEISSMIRISSLLGLFEQEDTPQSLNQPPLRRARMGLESFRAAEPDGVLDERQRRAAVVDAEPGAHPQERVDRESARPARRPAGRQHMIRPRSVVAQDFRR